MIYVVDQEHRRCLQCAKSLPYSQFTKSQWKKGRGNGRCLACAAENTTSDKGKTSFLLKAQQQSKSKPKKAVTAAPAATVAPAPQASPVTAATFQPVLTPASTTLVIRPRPQMAVPGFENLTVCSDWPQTKRGEPPARQSAIFMPLLACVIGPVSGYCTSSQLENAMQWWTQVLPAWPRWVEALKKAGVGQMRSRLLKSARGHPTRLIPKVKGSHGTIPHCWGKIQSQALERDPVVELEVHACVTLLYSQRSVVETAVNGKK